MFSQWTEKKHKDSYLVQIPTLHRSNSRMALRKVRIRTLHNKLIILTLCRTILKWHRFQWRIHRGFRGFAGAPSLFLNILSKSNPIPLYIRTPYPEILDPPLVLTMKRKKTQIFILGLDSYFAQEQF